MENKNYLGYVIMAFIFFTFYFGGKELIDNQILGLLLAGIGGMLGFFVSNKLKDSSNKTKWIAVIITLSIFVLTIYASTSYTDRKNNPIEGTWETDSSEGYSVRLRFNVDKVFLSMSPDYEEVEYSFSESGDRFRIMKEKEILFDWEIITKDMEIFLVENETETLEFIKK